jgi:DNA-binding XRE family transcriptional regulator
MDYSRNEGRSAGLSKKNTVDIEKGRNNAGWAVIVTVCALVPGEQRFPGMSGRRPLSILRILSRGGYIAQGQTMGGRVCGKR